MGVSQFCFANDAAEIVACAHHIRFWLTNTMPMGCASLAGILGHTRLETDSVSYRTCPLRFLSGAFHHVAALLREPSKSRGQ